MSALRQAAVRTLVCGVGGVVLAVPLDVWLHKGMPDVWTVLLGFVGGALPPTLLAAAWGDLPRFLSRGLDAAVASVGVLVVALASILAQGPLYVLMRRAEVATVTMAVGLMAVTIAALVETHRRLAAVIEEREQQLAAARRAEVEAQLRQLQAQIRPHFLFNTFNALSELIHEDADAAEDLVTDLAHLLRYSLRSSAADRVRLDEELAATRRYLRIEQARLGDRLSVTIDVDDDASALFVPGLVLQPLVENAVQHAIAPRTEGGRLRITGRRDGDALELVVQDDGPGLPPAVRDGSAEGLGSGGHGGGLANVRRRLALRFAEDANMSVIDAEGGGTRIELRLPAQERADVEDAG
jgi:LytS/YehU family sensor histidine kinase